IESYEADDILATIARQVEAAGDRCLLVTSDKDCRQLITDHVQLYDIRKKKVFDAATLMETWGIRPDQVVDFQAIRGDSTDNIPGVPGIGEKGAQELLAKFGTLDEVFAHVEEVSGAKRKENLIKGRELAFKSRELARLKTDMPIVVDWHAAKVGHFNPVAVADLCRECGFRQLAKRIETLAAKLITAPPGAGGEERSSAATKPGRGSPPVDLAPEDSVTAEVVTNQPPGLTTAASPEWKANYRTIATLSDLHELVTTLQQQSRIVLDTETTSLHPRRAEIVGYSFAWSPGEAVYIPVRAPAGEPQLDPAAVLAALRPVFENEAIQKIGQNLKYDQLVLRCAGVELRGVAFDTMVADYLLEPGERSHNMDDMARRHL
ncbi:MAG: DNA polymerase I, partial [Planctomycetia bacterium]|nr:DNA polymerase I [Planctomycetia bacterium]